MWELIICPRVYRTLMLGKEYEFDEETLSEAGFTILPDRKYRGEKFIGI